MAHKTHLRRHALERIIWLVEEAPNEPSGYTLAPFTSERGFLAWSADWLWIEVRSLATQKIIERYPIHPLTGVVVDKPWLRDEN